MVLALVADSTMISLCDSPSSAPFFFLPVPDVARGLRGAFAWERPSSEQETNGQTRPLPTLKMYITGLYIRSTSANLV
jgi:hypothetical protein